MMNILSGAHADTANGIRNSWWHSAPSFERALGRWCTTRSSRSLKRRGLQPGRRRRLRRLAGTTAALDLISRAIESAGLRPAPTALALDAAATEVLHRRHPGYVFEGHHPYTGAG